MGRFTALFAAAAIACTSGCSAYMANYPKPMAHVDIVLHENDFQTVKTHIKGHAECTYIIGIPMGKPEIYSIALGQIRDAAGMENRAVQLVNYTEDRTNFGLGWIWHVDRVTITADAIEYTK